MITWKVTSQGPSVVIEATVPLAVAGDLLDAVRAILPQLKNHVSFTRADDARRKREAAAREKYFAEQKKKWADLAQEVERQLSDLTADPKQRKLLIQELATEHEVEPAWLTFILARHRREVREKELWGRIKNAARLKRAGKTTAQIAAELGISRRKVTQYLAQHRNRARERRRQLRDFRERFKKPIFVRRELSS
jgi:hypothetical protein